MANVNVLNKARNVKVGSLVFNTYVSGTDAIQFLGEHAATGAMHDSEERYPPPMCHPGTREVVIVRIKDWYGFVTRPEKPIMWIHAPAGYGKTAIAGTISKMLEEVEGLDFNPLGATFYFWRTSPERNSPTRFVVTIAYQLAMSIPELTPHVENAVKRNPLILGKCLEVQLVKLIVEPFNKLGDSDGMPNRLVIIDGLDECINLGERLDGDPERYPQDQEDAQIRILNLIRKLQSYKLPLSFLLLSRPEAWIKLHLGMPFFVGLVEEVDLYALGDHLYDTELYIRAELSRIAARIGGGRGVDGRDEWPGEDLVQNFIWRTNGHMLYASIVIRYIDNPYEDPRDLLQHLFSDHGNVPSPDLAHTSPLSSLYELYKQIMRSCPAPNRPRMIEVLEELEVASDLFDGSLAFERVTAILDCLAGREAGQGFRALRPLHAVLHLADPDGQHSKPAFSPYIHSTFSSFLLDPCPSLGLPINPSKGYQRILFGSLDSMSRITLQTEMDEDHLRFSVTSWPRLFWHGWYSNSPDAEYFEAVEKLLKTDIRTCWIKALTIGEGSPSRGLLEYEDVYRADAFNFVVPRSAEHIIRENHLVQQAVSHVASSCKAALIHLLAQSSDAWPKMLGYYVLLACANCHSRGGLRSSGVEQIFQALEMLGRDRPEDARRLVEGNEGHFASLGFSFSELV